VGRNRKRAIDKRLPEHPEAQFDSFLSKGPRTAPTESATGDRDRHVGLRLRVSEVCDLAPGDVLAPSRPLRVRHGKGDRDARCR